MCDLAFPKQDLVLKPATSPLVDSAMSALHFPLAAKLQSTDLTHRSDHGGVKLNLHSRAEVDHAIDSLFMLADDLKIHAEGVLLQEMHSISYELIVGLKTDELFGPLLMIGRGGIDVELRPDVQIALLPLTAADIKAQLLKLDSAELFMGHRGRAVVDLDALAQSLEVLTEGFLNDNNLVELELNPLAVTDSGSVIALDALGTERCR